MAEQIRCMAAAVAVWLHDYRGPIASTASFLTLSAALGAALWLYQALCFVVNA